MKKRLLLALLVLCLTICAFSVTVGAEGEAADLEIGTVDELVAFATAVNDGNKYEGKTVVLTDDIDLSSVANWTPIGNNVNYFWGTFDGQNHTISNMTINVDDSSVYQYVGLFGGVKKATVKNLTVEDAKIDAVGERVYAGAVFAVAHSNSENHTTANLNFENITVDDCIINAESKSGSAYIGGFAGYCYPANMKNISVSNLELKPKASGTVFVGGMVGYMQGQNISNNGNTRAYYTVDGLELENISITAETVSVLGGGFAGYTYYGYITMGDVTIDGFKADITGTTTSDVCVGGLIGLAHRSDKGHTFTEVNATGIDLVVDNGMGSNTAVGGMVGYSGSPIAYSDCSVEGTITEKCTTTGAMVGGFVGRTVSWAQSYTDCVADVDVTGTNIVGGFTGYNTVTATYTNCEASGTVEGTTTGGFVGITSNGTYIECNYTGGSDVPFSATEGVAGLSYVAQIGETKYTSLQDALDAAAAGSGEVTVEILKDIDLTNDNWNPVTVGAPGYPKVTVNGNDHTITGLNNMLFAGTWAGGSGLIINDLTIEDSNIVNDEDDTAGTVGVGAFIGFPQASATVTLNNCHLVNSTVEGGHWTGGLIGMAGGYNGNDGPVFMNLTIKDCSVTGSTITGKGSVGGVIGHGSCAAWTQVTITDTEVSNNTITSTGSSTNKAGSIMGTIGAAGQPTTANGETKTGGATICATTSGNTVTSNGTVITTVYGRQGTNTGLLVMAKGGSYEAYPIEDGVSYAAPAEGHTILKNFKGTYGVVEADEDEIENKATVTIVLDPATTEFKLMSGTEVIGTAAGEYELLGGTYTYTASKTGYEPTSGTITVAGEDQTISIELVAIPTYTVIFDLGYDDLTVPETVYENEYATYFEPSRDGYIFDGWYNRFGWEFDFETPITRDITLYAQWTREKQPEVVIYMPVSVETTENGSIDLRDDEGGVSHIVYFDVDPDKGYTVEDVWVVDAEGNNVRVTREDSDTYSFRMPNSAVTIGASFKKVLTYNPFADVVKGEYYYDAVLWAVDNGITTGMNGLFLPYNDCTRGQFVTFLWRAAGCPAPQSASSAFVDVDPSAYYYNAMLWAVENGITTGMSAETFNPDGIVDRGQVVTFLYRYAGAPRVNSGESFVDVDPASYCAAAVQWAVNNGITQGTSAEAKTFNPLDSCTRGQVVTFLYRFFG